MEINDEGESERQKQGIDGTMGDAQDIQHKFVEASSGQYCILCGLNEVSSRHLEELEK
jgi:hypothetical protein